MRNIIFSFFAVPPSHNYISDNPKQLFFYDIFSLNASFRCISKLGYYQFFFFCSCLNDDDDVDDNTIDDNDDDNDNNNNENNNSIHF